MSSKNDNDSEDNNAVKKHINPMYNPKSEGNTYIVAKEAKAL